MSNRFKWYEWFWYASTYVFEVKLDPHVDFAHTQRLKSFWQAKDLIYVISMYLFCIVVINLQVMSYVARSF